MKAEIKKILYKFLQDGISSDDATQQVLDLFNVSQQRELLIEYEKHHYTSNEWISVSEQCVEAIDNFLKTKTNENKKGNRG